MQRGLVRGAAVITLVAVLLTGCAYVEQNPKTAIGAAGGATVGGLIAAGATAVGDVMTNDQGDQVAMLRDPWGVAVQLVRRERAMLASWRS